ncbi:hypothetical protein Tco_0886091 [Tanacetum coccineum]
MKPSDHTSLTKSPPLQGPTSTYAEATRINVADLLHLKGQKLDGKAKEDICELSKAKIQGRQTLVQVVCRLLRSLVPVSCQRKGIGKKYEEQPQPKKDQRNRLEKRKPVSQRLQESKLKRQAFEMSEQQRKRATEVQQQAQYYTEEDWDLIRARMEASTKLRKSVFGTDIDDEDYAKKMVELVEKNEEGD